MSKVGFWLKGSTGKLAGATMYKEKGTGETIMREVVTPSNPKTDKQNIQRIIMHTVMNAYSAMKSITDHSFEGQAAGRDTMGYFLKNNIQLCRESIQRMQNQGVDFYDMYNFLPLGKKEFVANAYQISMGSLPRVAVNMVEDRLAAVVPAITVNTYQGVIDALNLQRGDQLTFCTVIELEDGVSKEFRFSRVILDPTDPETHLQAPLSTPFIVAGKVNFPSVRNEGTVHFDNDLTSGLVFTEYNPSHEGVIAAAVIVSRQQGDAWLRSTAYLTYQSAVDYNLGECMDRAVNGASTPVYAPNEYYLNNAGQGNNTAVETGEGSSAGSGGNTPAPETSVSGVTVGGVNAIVGTDLAVNDPSDNPTQQTVVVTLSNGANADVKVVKYTDDTLVQAAVANAQGVATIQFTPVFGTRYKILFGDEDTASGYTFTYNHQGGQLIDDGE